ncbi:hypothetical protein C8R44DRAFT_731699 [Mycena epipterygia]|nr:hypothetical protein C8R44DRAFT_731699 [Mycena epipterygia]
MQGREDRGPPRMMDPANEDLNPATAQNTHPKNESGGKARENFEALRAEYVVRRGGDGACARASRRDEVPPSPSSDPLPSRRKIAAQGAKKRSIPEAPSAVNGQLGLQQTAWEGSAGRKVRGQSRHEGGRNTSLNQATRRTSRQKQERKNPKDTRDSLGGRKFRGEGARTKRWNQQRAERLPKEENSKALGEMRTRHDRRRMYVVTTARVEPIPRVEDRRARKNATPASGLGLGEKVGARKRINHKWNRNESGGNSECAVNKTRALAGKWWHRRAVNKTAARRMSSKR